MLDISETSKFKFVAKLLGHMTVLTTSVATNSYSRYEYKLPGKKFYNAEYVNP